MNGRLLVSPEQMTAAASELSVCIKEMETCFQNMQTTVNGSVSYWEGKAGQAHRELYEKQVSKTEEIIRRYLEHVRDLNEMAGVFAEAEARATALAEELPASIL